MTNDDPRNWMWSEALQMLARAERLHRDVFSPPHTSHRGINWEPPTDVLETQDAVLVLVALPGVGSETGGALLVAIGDNPDRLRNEAAFFAALCGASPVDASSGRHQRHRLNRGGNRDANRALWVIVMCRMAKDATTRAYVERRTGRA